MPIYITQGRMFRGRLLKPQFRPPNGVPRKPVKGGRWKVRKVVPNRKGQGWYAWTEGKGIGLGLTRRYFYTFKSAFRYAELRSQGVEDVDAYILSVSRRYEVIDAPTES